MFYEKDVKFVAAFREQKLIIAVSKNNPCFLSAPFYPSQRTTL
jgi:hypothetical protein